MKLSIETRKGKGIDELLRAIIPQPPEQIHQPTPRSPSTFERILQKYQQFCLGPEESADEPVSYRRWIQNPNSETYSPFMLPEVLTPAEINALVQLLPPAEIRYVWPASDRQYRRRNVFINKLIQNSFNAGYNDFIISTETLEQALSLFYLQGTAELPLKIEVQGPLDTCSNLAFMGASISGKVLSCGGNIWGSSLSIGERMGNFCPDGSSYSAFTLLPGISAHSTQGVGPRHCTFKTSDQKTFALWKINFGNLFEDFQLRLVYIYPDGKEEVVSHPNYKGKK